MTTQGATQSGVQNTDADIDNNTNTETERPLSARELAMEALSASRNAKFEQESGIKIEPFVAPAITNEDDEDIDRDDDTGTVTPPVNAKAKAALDNQLNAQLGQDGLLTDGLDKVKVRVKIDGEEREVSVADMTRHYQKDQAADKRLAEATRLLNEAKEKAQTAAGAVDNSQHQRTEQTNTDAAGTVKEFLQTLFEGDEDKATEKLLALLGGRQSATLDEAQLAAKLTPAIKQQLVVDSASAQFQKDYADIVADPYLASVADGFLESGLKKGLPFDEAMENAGQLTRGWIAEKAGVKTAGQNRTTSRAEKLDKKASMDNIAATNATASQRNEPPATASDTIAEMRKARGLG